MKTNHSPLPWRVSTDMHGIGNVPVDGVESINGMSIANCGINGISNAEFIVRACNSHAALVLALQILHDEIADYITINKLGALNNQSMKMARAALAIAKGE